MNVTSDDAVRELFNAEDEKKIIKIEKWGQSNKVVHFKDLEERDAVLAALPDEVKSRNGEDRSRPLVKVFQARDNKPYGAPRGGAGSWGSTRGGNSSNAPQGGYRSGGASDSEGGRGGRGGRGSRGGRGGERGRGRGGGRGSFKTEGSPAPAPATPAAGDS